MPAFKYKALKLDNEVIEGQLETASESLAVTKLQEMGYYVVSLKTVESSTHFQYFKPSISQTDILQLTQKLAVTLKAGIKLDVALVLLKDTADSEFLKSFLENIILSIHNGQALSEALEEHSNAFDIFYITSIRAAEATGSLDIAFNNLSHYLSRTHALNRSIKAALIYPTVLAFVACITLLILLLYVVPQFQTIFDDMGQALPLSTQIVIYVADTIKSYGWVVPLVLGLTYFLFQYGMKSISFKIKLEQFKLSIPLISGLIIKRNIVSFTRTLAALITNNVSIVDALSIVSTGSHNAIFRQAINQVNTDIQNGLTISSAMLKQTVFPATAVQLIKVGEESGELADMLVQVSNIYEEELEDGIKQFLALLEPVMIVVLGIIIAGIIISVLLAILSLNDFII